MKIYKDGIGAVDLVASMGSDLTIVNAARVSYGKHKDELDERDIKLIKYMMDHKHTSVFEHCSMTFRYKVPLFVRSQHHRHRTQSFSEISRRYTGENLEFYSPEKWRIQSKSSKQASVDAELDHSQMTDVHNSIIEECLKAYNKLLELGAAKEMARMVLPQSLYTEYYATVNLKNALDFLVLRLHKHAQLEIQLVAKAMQVHMTSLYPETMKLFNEKLPTLIK